MDRGAAPTPAHGVADRPTPGHAHGDGLRLLRRLGLGKLSALEPKPEVVRYERARPGELVHVDIKLLGRIGRVGHRITGDRRNRVRGIGWEYVHVAVDDASRLAYVEVLKD